MDGTTTGGGLRDWSCLQRCDTSPNLLLLDFHVLNNNIAGVSRSLRLECFFSGFMQLSCPSAEKTSSQRPMLQLLSRSHTQWHEAFGVRMLVEYDWLYLERVFMCLFLFFLIKMTFNRTCAFVFAAQGTTKPSVCSKLGWRTVPTTLTSCRPSR